MAVLNHLTDDGTMTLTHLFYQDPKSQLRRLVKTPDPVPSWTGGPNLSIVASDARAQTPIAVLNYTTTATSDFTVSMGSL